MMNTFLFRNDMYSTDVSALLKRNLVSPDLIQMPEYEIFQRKFPNLEDIISWMAKSTKSSASHFSVTDKFFQILPFVFLAGNPGMLDKVCNFGFLQNNLIIDWFPPLELLEARMSAK